MSQRSQPFFLIGRGLTRETPCEWQLWAGSLAYGDVWRIKQWTLTSFSVCWLGWNTTPLRLHRDTQGYCREGNGTCRSWAFEVTAAPVDLSPLLWVPFFLTVTRNRVLWERLSPVSLLIIRFGKPRSTSLPGHRFWTAKEEQVAPTIHLAMCPRKLAFFLHGESFSFHENKRQICAREEI